MVAAVYFPSLSEDGWVTSPERQADYIMSHFFASDYSQTQLYLSHVASMSWVIAEANGDVNKTISLLTSSLTSYLGNYFTNVVVSVRESIPAVVTDATRVSLIIDASFIDDTGNTIILGKLLEIQNSLFSKITNISNG